MKSNYKSINIDDIFDDDGHFISALSASGKIRVIHNLDDCKTKIIDMKTGIELSDLGQYSILGSKGNMIKSIKFSGERIIHFLDSDGKLLDEVYMRSNYQYMKKRIYLVRYKYPILTNIILK